MEIQQILGYLLNTAARMIKRTMDDNLSKYNITTSQWAVLKLLDSKPGLAQTEISRVLSSDKATVGDVILRLIEKDYIEKSVNVKDRRGYSVSLTPKAKELIKDMERMASDVTLKALYGMEDTDIQNLNKSLQQIIRNLSKEESLCPGDEKY